MDFPKSVPGIGLVGGKFVDEDQLTGTPGSLIPAQWGNSVTEELLNVIAAAGFAPNEAANNQLITAIKAITGGRLINVAVFNTSGIYPRSVGTKAIRIRLVSGGGAGGGATATNASQISAGTGGCSGSYAEGYYTTVPATATVTVGLGGIGVQGTTGGNGGSSSVGSLISVSGGTGGNQLGPTVPPLTANVNPAGTSITGANIMGIHSAAPPMAFVTSLSVGYSGQGASSLLGAGGASVNGSGNGTNGSGFGSGGGGALCLASSIARAGGNGTNGIVIIEEYS